MVGEEEEGERESESGLTDRMTAERSFPVSIAVTTVRISPSSKCMEGGRTIIAVSNTVSFFLLFQVSVGLANVERTAAQCGAGTGMENIGRSF